MSESNTMPMNKLLQRILLMTANELDARYGPHPMTDIETCKTIAQEVMRKIVVNPDQKLIDALNNQIDHAFGTHT